MAKKKTAAPPKKSPKSARRAAARDGRREETQKPLSPAKGTKKLRIRYYVRTASDDYQSWCAVPELVDSESRVLPGTGGDPTIDISSPAAGSNEPVNLAFQVSGNVQPSAATVTVGLSQSGGSVVWANPKNPVPDGNGDWSTQVTPTVTGQAILGASAMYGTAFAATSEMLTITN
jgi:hypothetical protein